MFACLHSPSTPQGKLLALASSFSPLVEDTAPGVVVFSIVGLGRLFGDPQEIAAVVARRGAEAGIHANLAVSTDPDTAVLAAKNRKGLTLIPPGKEADRLGELPVNVLGIFLSDSNLEILETLNRWGIKTLGEIAELPELGFIARFGEEGTRLMRLARGETRRSLRAVQPPENYERRTNFEHPQSLLEPLLFVISSMLGELMEALERQGLATNRVTLDLKLAGKIGNSEAQHKRTLEFPVPVRDPKVILKQLQFDLEAHPPKAAILRVGIMLNPVEPRTLQHGLFTPQAPAPEKLQLTLARLTALAGEGNVGSPYLLDTHRRDAFRMRAFVPEEKGNQPPTAPSFPRYAFRYYRPPLSAQVRVKAERPVHVTSTTGAATRAAGEVVAAAGPWRASGDWWSPSPWSREEWDVELSNGGVYRVFLSLSSARAWFLEGMYD
jgi:protein ImuB